MSVYMFYQVKLFDAKIVQDVYVNEIPIGELPLIDARTFLENEIIQINNKVTLTLKFQNIEEEVSLNYFHPFYVYDVILDEA